MFVHKKHIRFPWKSDAIRKKEIFNTAINLSGLDDLDTYVHDITKMFRWLNKLKLPKKPVIFDVGAHIGVITLAYASIFKDSKYIVSSPYHTLTTGS